MTRIWDQELNYWEISDSFRFNSGTFRILANVFALVLICYLMSTCILFSMKTPATNHRAGAQGINLPTSRLSLQPFFHCLNPVNQICMQVLWICTTRVYYFISALNQYWNDYPPFPQHQERMKGVLRGCTLLHFARCPIFLFIAKVRIAKCPNEFHEAKICSENFSGPLYQNCSFFGKWCRTGLSTKGVSLSSSGQLTCPACWRSERVIYLSNDM